MKDKLLIIGASGHGKVVADIAMKMNKWKTIAFLDDDKNIEECMKLDRIGKVEDAFTYKNEADFFIAIGNNTTRERIQEEYESKGLSVVSLIHPSVIIGTDVEIDNGTVIMAGVVINSSSRIGKGCIINTSSSLDHDNIIEDYVHLSPGTHLAGTVKIGKGSWIGIGASISNNVNISSRCMIGAGGVVSKDLTKSGTYVGVPVRKID